MDIIFFSARSSKAVPDLIVFTEIRILEDEQKDNPVYVELFVCNSRSCRSITRFPRSFSPGKVIETRRGRCDESAQVIIQRSNIPIDKQQFTCRNMTMFMFIFNVEFRFVIA